MAAFFGNLRNVVIASFVLAILLVGVYCATQGFDGLAFELFLLRWLHVISGVMWIGLLWYLNFVQVPSMPSIPVENRSAITKVIAPNVLFYFRYAALATVITGLLVAWMQHFIVEALTFQKGFIIIGTGMWMALIMAFNVWFIIWPNQQKILGLVPATDEQKAAAAKPALYASRFNTMFSIGMLYCMVIHRFLPV
jgi:uncharacterized membrane protein